MKANGIKVSVELKDYEEVKATLGIFKQMLSDERIDLSIRLEYKNRFDNLLEQLKKEKEFDEYCKINAESHKDLE